MKKRINKTQLVLDHLEKYGTITSLEAIELYSATRLSSIIYNLRKRGHDIVTEKIPFTDKYGTKSICGKYILND